MARLTLPVDVAIVHLIGFDESTVKVPTAPPNNAAMVSRGTFESGSPCLTNLLRRTSAVQGFGSMPHCRTYQAYHDIFAMFVMPYQSPEPHDALVVGLLYASAADFLILICIC